MAEGTAMKTGHVLLGLVPVGEENAVTTGILWQVNRVGAVATVKCANRFGHAGLSSFAR
jgi:hypothetical protein